MAKLNGIDANAYFAGNLQHVAGGEPNTLYEIGSLSKPLTGLVLADMVGKGQVKLADSINRYLPKPVQRPEFAPITLEHLATHTAGFPRLPPSMDPPPGDPKVLANFSLTDPYADYNQKRLLADLTKVRLAPPGQHVYSNFGYGLLGYLLARANGTSYETLVQKRLFDPLEMNDSFVYYDKEGKPPTEAKPSRKVNASGQNASPWRFQEPFAAAGALKSTPHDMGLLLKKIITNDLGALQPAWQLATRPRKTMVGPTQIGLGWMVTGSGVDQIIWHNGATGGYTSFLGVMPKRKIGICLLAAAGGNQNPLTLAGLQWLRHAARLQRVSKDQAGSGK